MYDERHIISLKKPQVPQEPPKMPEPPVMSKKRSRAPLYIVFGLVVIALLIVGVAKFNLLARFSGTHAVPTANTNDDGDLVNVVGQLIQLPIGEVPTVITIDNPEKYIEQPFFKKAKVGDKVLVYIEAKEAYLYRPSSHLLIEVSPITPQSD